jgi:hypothetical protein
LKCVSNSVRLRSLSDNERSRISMDGRALSQRHPGRSE